MPIVPRFSLSLTVSDILSCALRLPSQGKAPERISEFEKAFAEFIGAKYAFFLPSARLGLFLALKNLDLPEGSGIIVPAWTHASVPAMVAAAGFRPLFTDIDNHTFNMSPEIIPPELLEQAKAIIPTHLYGCPCPMDEITALAKARNLIVIEDCAQGFGAKYDGRIVGSLGDASYFSFSLTKNYTTLGGGMVATSRDDLAEKLREALKDRKTSAKIVGPLIKSFAFRMGTRPLIFAMTLFPLLRIASGSGKDPLHDAFEEHIGTSVPNTKGLALSDLQAWLGMEQLKSIDEKNRKRHEAGTYLLGKLDDVTEATLPVLAEKGWHIFLSFVIKTRNRKAVARELLKRGVDTSPGYLKACFLLPELSKYRTACPVAEASADEQLHLPVYPEMTEKALDHIARSLKEALAAVHGKH
jgi:dTDP-4-amino-4,6-dideoxygalactose transaminase